MTGRTIAITVLFGWVGLACQSRQPTGPEETYRAFYRAIQEKDWDTVVALLAPEVVERLQRTGRRMARLQEHEEIEPLEYMLLNVSADFARPLRSVEVVSREEGVAVLEITAGLCQGDKKCSVSEVTMRRHAGGWVLSPQVPPLLRGGHRPERDAERDEP